MWWLFLQQAFTKAWFFFRVSLFVLTRQELSSTRTRIVVITLLKSNFWKFIAELHSNGIVVWRFRHFLVWGLQSGNDTVFGSKRLHLLESWGTLITCFSFCRLEGMKLWSHGTHNQAWHTPSDDVSYLSISWPISDFWNPLRLEALKRFCIEILNSPNKILSRQQFPPPESEKLFKCPIIGLFQVIKCPHPLETFQ